ncbi:MAG: T9SS type A sorting domain-containing protein, partial [Bacteroidetes bacterium]|nr:T9SS type A sorting domain-containing protein [Bacteroidota bacterium]
PNNIASGTLQNGAYGSSVSKQLYGDADSVITATFGTGFSGFGIGDNTTVLPIDLVSFTVAADGFNAQLKWSTASEKNNKLFEIERSTNGQQFEKIDEVKGVGNSYQLHQYDYTDLKVLTDYAKVYYRLKQIDFDGTYKYSSIEYIQKAYQNKVNTSIYPQPAKQQLYVNTNLSFGFNYTIHAADGRVVLTGNSNTPNLVIDVSKLTNGNYILRIADGENNVQTMKFVKAE